MIPFQTGAIAFQIGAIALGTWNFEQKDAAISQLPDHIIVFSIELLKELVKAALDFLVTVDLETRLQKHL
jgi:hypothetical protein